MLVDSRSRESSSSPATATTEPDAERRASIRHDPSAVVRPQLPPGESLGDDEQPPSVLPNWPDCSPTRLRTREQNLPEHAGARLIVLSKLLLMTARICCCLSAADDDRAGHWREFLPWLTYNYGVFHERYYVVWWISLVRDTQEFVTAVSTLYVRRLGWSLCIFTTQWMLLFSAYICFGGWSDLE